MYTGGLYQFCLLPKHNYMGVVVGILSGSLLREHKFNVCGCHNLNQFRKCVHSTVKGLVFSVRKIFECNVKTECV